MLGAIAGYSQPYIGTNQGMYVTGYKFSTGDPDASRERNNSLHVSNCIGYCDVPERKPKKPPIQKRYFNIVYISPDKSGDFTIVTNGAYPNRSKMMDSALIYSGSWDVVITNIWEMSKKDYLNWIKK